MIGSLSAVTGKPSSRCARQSASSHRRLLAPALPHSVRVPRRRAPGLPHLAFEVLLAERARDPLEHRVHGPARNVDEMPHRAGEGPDRGLGVRGVERDQVDDGVIAPAAEQAAEAVAIGPIAVEREGALREAGRAAAGEDGDRVAGIDEAPGESVAQEPGPAEHEHLELSHVSDSYVWPRGDHKEASGRRRQPLRRSALRLRRTSHDD